MLNNLNPLYESITDDFGVHKKDAALRTGAMFGPFGVAAVRIFGNTKFQNRGSSSPSYSQKTYRPKVKKQKVRKQRVDTSNFRNSTDINNGPRIPEQFKDNY